MGQKIQKSLGLVLMIALLMLGLAQPAIALTDNQRLVNEAWRIVNRVYLDDTFNHHNWSLVRQAAFAKPMPDRAAAYQNIRQMLSALGDPFTRLLTPDQYHSLQTNTAGELTGVGLQIALDAQTDQLRVVAPIAGSPADLAGLQPADVILEIDGMSTLGLTLDEAAERMRGPAGTSVRLTVQRSQQRLQIPLQRDVIVLNPVVSELRSLSEPAADFKNQEQSVSPDSAALKVGYLRLTQFSANATKEIAHALVKFEQAGAAAYVLDLRNNPGGLLQAGIEVARLWLDQGAIVYTANRWGISDSFLATGTAITDAPLVVLVNQGTASASEILAGALQDQGRAILVGERTFGKGLIQSLFELSDGSGLAVTVARYETPNHRDINRQGIQPDRVVATGALTRDQVATVADRQYQTAIQILLDQVRSSRAA